MPVEPRCATCWTGAEVRCPICKGPMRDLDDEYGSLAEGGSYERFECVDEQCRQQTIYIQLPD